MIACYFEAAKKYGILVKNGLLFCLYLCVYKTLVLVDFGKLETCSV